MANGLPRFMHNGSEVIDRERGNERLHRPCPMSAERYADWLNKLIESSAAQGLRECPCCGEKLDLKILAAAPDYNDKACHCRGLSHRHDCPEYVMTL